MGTKSKRAASVDTSRRSRCDHDDAKVQAAGHDGDEDGTSEVIEFRDDEARRAALRDTLRTAHRHGRRRTGLYWAGRLLNEHGELARTRLRDQWDPTWDVSARRIDDLLCKAGVPWMLQTTIFGVDEPIERRKVPRRRSRRPRQPAKVFDGQCALFDG